MKRPVRALGAALLAAVLLAGCAHLEPGDDGLSFGERRLRLESIPAWEMRGRLAVNTGERAFQGSFRWAQDDAHSTLTVRGPLGGGILEVAGSPDRMLVTARGEQRVLEDPETELSALLGWWMPVDSLRAWLLGLPDPGFRANTRIGAGTVLEALDQRLWHVEYASYQLSDGLLVPRRIDMAHGALELRLTVDAWSSTASAVSAATRLELGATGTAKYPR
jgi:outer membrane lipoprotein LolB